MSTPIYKIILKSELIRNTSFLVSGTVLAQLIALVLQPFIRRLFPAEAFGSFVVYSSIIGMITVISSFRYDDAIVIPRNDEGSVNLIGLSIIFSFIFNLLLIFLVIIFDHHLIDFLNLPSDLPTVVLYFIPLAAFLVNSFQAVNWWLIRKKKFAQVSANKLMRRGSEGIMQVVLGISKFSNGLIISDIVGQVANILIALWQSLRNGLKVSMVNLNQLKYVLKHYSEFPKYNLLPAFMSACSFYLPPIFINKFYSSAFAGYYDLTKMLLSVPIAFVATSVSNVLLQKASEKYLAGESIMNEMKPMIYFVLLAAVTEILVIVLASDYIFMIFGKEWNFSGELSLIMIWSFALNFIVSSFNSLFIAMQKIKLYSLWQVIYFIAIISLLLFKKLEFLKFLKIYMAIEVLCFLLVIILMIRIVSRYEKEIALKEIQ